MAVCEVWPVIGHDGYFGDDPNRFEDLEARKKPSRFEPLDDDRKFLIRDRLLLQIAAAMTTAAALIVINRKP